MKRLTIEQVIEKVKTRNPNLVIDQSTYINTSTKCKMSEEPYGEFWVKPGLIISGKQAGHPSGAKDRAKNTNLLKYGTEHPFQSECVKNKIRQTNIEKFGCENPNQNRKVREKVEHTNTLKYGHKNPTQNKDVKQKAKTTVKDKYGTDHPMQNNSVKAKTKKTNRERYGTDWTCEDPAIREKQTNTNIDRYGCPNPFGNETIKQKIRDTNTKKYGHENPMQNEKVRLKAQAKWCLREPSKGESEVLQFVRSLGFDASKGYIGGSEPFEVDILIKSKGIGIEYNGDYWHSERNSAIHPLYHINKTTTAAKSGIQVIHVFESEWLNKRSICENIIRSKLGVFKRRIFARKCRMGSVDTKAANLFFETNHLQGKARLTCAYGLFHDDELVACIGISKPHRQNMSGDMHLSRFACFNGTQVVGGLSRLAKYAVSHNGPLVSYVHRRLSTGAGYISAGFTEVMRSGADYWYWDTKKHKCVPKQSRKKSLVKTPKGMTEHEHALLDGLARIYDCGKIKFRIV